MGAAAANAPRAGRPSAEPGARLPYRTVAPRRSSLCHTRSKRPVVACAHRYGDALRSSNCSRQAGHREPAPNGWVAEAPMTSPQTNPQSAPAMVALQVILDGGVGMAFDTACDTIFK